MRVLVLLAVVAVAGAAAVSTSPLAGWLARAEEAIRTVAAQGLDLMARRMGWRTIPELLLVAAIAAGVFFCWKGALLIYPYIFHGQSKGQGQFTIREETAPVLEETFYRLLPFALSNVAMNVCALLTFAVHAGGASSVVGGVLLDLLFLGVPMQLVLLCLITKTFADAHPGNEVAVYRGTALWGVPYALAVGAAALAVLLAVEDGTASAESVWTVIGLGWVGLFLCLPFTVLLHVTHNRKVRNVGPVDGLMAPGSR